MQEDNNMPEKMTKEEAIIAMAIKKARHAKSMLRESTQIMPYDHEVEVVKVKRPKAQNVKIKNQTQKKEGYGLAGETLKKAKFEGPVEELPMPKTIGRLKGILFRVNQIAQRETIDEESHKQLKSAMKEVNSVLDEFDKYKKFNVHRADEENLMANYFKD